MNSLLIEYFVTVARLGSLSRAALELGIEQSTISRHITKLESEVGIRLFHRSGRGVQLTDAGQAFMAEAQQVVEALMRTRTIANELTSQGPTQLVIAAQPTVAQLAFPSAAHRLRQRFPHLRLRVREALGHQLIHWLVEGEIDLAIIYVPTQAHVVHVDPILKEPLFCISAPDFPLPGETLDCRQLLDLPMVLPSTQHGLRTIMASLAQEHGCSMAPSIECDGSTALTKRLVEAGHGCTILPLAGVQREVAQGLLKATPIQGDRLVRTIAIATARNRPVVASSWEISQIVRTAMTDLVREGAWPGVERLTEPSRSSPGTSDAPWEHG